MKDFLVKPVRLALKRLGYELSVKPFGDGSLTPVTQLEHPYDALYQHGDVAFEVPLEKLCYPYHFSYDPAGWHPFVTVLKEYQANPDLRYEDSVLHDYYQSYQPNNVLEAFFYQSPDLLRYSDSGLAGLSIPPFDPFFPWDPEKPRAQSEQGLDASQGHQGFGPVSLEKGRLEFERLTHTYTSIKQTGYRPSNDHNGDIRGYLLRNSGDYRFFVRQGLHRAAALSAIGYSKARVRFFIPYPRAVFLADCANWPQVKAGVMSADLAKRIFTLFFEENGVEKAARLGLLDKQFALNS